MLAALTGSDIKFARYAPPAVQSLRVVAAAGSHASGRGGVIFPASCWVLTLPTYLP